MGIFLRQSHNVKPPRWGSPTDVQYAIRENSWNIYGCNPDNNILVMPLFWGLPPLDYSGHNNHGILGSGSIWHSGYANIGANATEDITVLNSSTFDIGDIPQSIIVGVNFPGGHDIDTPGNMLMANITDSWILQGAISDDGKIRFGTYGGNIQTVKDDWAAATDFNIIAIYKSSTDCEIFVNGESNIAGSPANTIVASGLPLEFGYRDAAGTASVFGGQPFLLNHFIFCSQAITASQAALFHNRPWDLYRPVSRPVYFLPTMEAIMNQFQGVNLGADLFNGTLL